MNTKQFKKQFPSLKIINCSNSISIFDTNDYVEINDIEVHCLDKQKVKDAINELYMKHNQFPLDAAYSRCCDDLMFKLGLE